MIHCQSIYPRSLAPSSWWSLIQEGNIARTSTETEQAFLWCMGPVLAINSISIPDGEFAEGPVSKSSSEPLHSTVLPLLNVGILHLFGVVQQTKIDCKSGLDGEFLCPKQVKKQQPTMLTSQCTRRGAKQVKGGRKSQETCQRSCIQVNNQSMSKIKAFHYGCNVVFYI